MSKKQQSLDPLCLYGPLEGSSKELTAPASCKRCTPLRSVLCQLGRRMVRSGNERLFRQFLVERRVLWQSDGLAPVWKGEEGESERRGM